MPKEYFEEMYSRDPDPWGFETRWYERRKYNLCMAALPEPRYRSAFEPGCSVGVLSESLAERCDSLLAADLLAPPLERARKRLAVFDHVRVEQLSVPQDWPCGDSFDLVVLSELAYYFDAATLGRIIGLANGSLDRGGTLLGAHWRGITDYPLSGDEAHALIGASPCLELVAHFEQAEFLVDVWCKP